jgi:CoA:oxalate CoA-transferase
MVVDVDYPGGAVGMFGLPVKLSETPGDPRAQAPASGQHNDDVLGAALGLSAERLAELRERRVI